MNFLEKLKNEVDVELRSFFAKISKDDFSESEKRLFEAVEYGATLGGKRIRPILGILCAEACNKDFPRKLLIENLISIELIHAYSLIHDDLPDIDNDEFRRGQPTVWRKFGTNTAIFAGDVLQTLAFENLGKVAPEYVLKKLLKVLTEASGFAGMCGGQARDVLGNDEMSEDDLKVLHRKKTGALFVAAAKFGVILVEADEDRSTLVEEFAENLGLSFQVSDDLLDGDGFVSLWGEAKTKEFLNELTENLVRIAKSLNSKRLEDLGRFIAERKV